MINTIDFEGWKKRQRQISRQEFEVKLDAAKKLPKSEYEQRRKELAAEIGVRASFLDAEYRTHRNGEPGNRPPHWHVEPWGEAVRLRDLIIKIGTRVRRHVVLGTDAAMAVSLWIAFTCVHEAAVHSPILIVTSPEPNCGKSTLLGLVSYMVPRGLIVVEISPAVLYRMIESWHPTLIVDEADVAFRNNPELRAVINAGWTRGAGVPRCHPDTHEPELFDTFGPKAIGLKGLKVPDTTLSRGIVIEMERKLPTDKAEGFKHIDDADLQDIRRMLLRWSADNLDAIKAAEPLAPDGFANRLSDNWRIMFAIADQAGFGAEARKAAVNLSQGHDAVSLSTQLIIDCKTAMEAARVDRMKSADLVSALAAMEDRHWAEMPSNHKPITQPQVAKLLKGFKIRPEPMRVAGERMARGYKLEEIVRVLGRYGPGASSQNPRHTVTTAEGGQITSNIDQPDVTVDMLEDSQCYAVTPAVGAAALQPDSEHLNGDFEERAAILEYDGGMSRAEAEAHAADEFSESPALLNRRS